jgi:hypothetical protein
MKLFACALLLGVSAASAASADNIKIPYFERMKSQDICGSDNGCQPTSSQSWSKIKDPLDYYGVPGEFLGRSFKNSAFETSPCVAVANTSTDVRTAGGSTVQATVQTSAKGALSANLQANIAKLVAERFSALPDTVKADLKAKLDASMTSTLDQAVELKYQRIDMTQVLMDAKLGECLAALPGNRKAITGISTLTVTGNWSRTRLAKAFADFEASAGYTENLSASAKGDYQTEKTATLVGTFEPLSLVFAVAYRKGTGR